jgi:hypothetical protein
MDEEAEALLGSERSNSGFCSPGSLGLECADAVALFRNVKRLELDVAQHVPIHGNPGPAADFERIVGPVAARAPAAGGGG